LYLHWWNRRRSTETISKKLCVKVLFKQYYLSPELIANVVSQHAEWKCFFRRFDSLWWISFSCFSNHCSAFNFRIKEFKYSAWQWRRRQ
jgi:hypothetical protein